VSPPFHLAAPDCARALLGWTLTVDGVGGVIVETEAYDRTDPASHSFRGQTPSNAAMFGPPGCAYVYRSYGVHWCLNVVCGEAGSGQAVLIRALEPTRGVTAMRDRRRRSELRQLCSGPGKLTEAMAVTRALDGQPLTRAPFALVPPSSEVDIAVGRRIGITKGVETPWRFGLKRSPYLSRPIHPEDPLP
jgi:DNA-3-methyladenine glycosylase